MVSLSLVNKGLISLEGLFAFAEFVLIHSIVSGTTRPLQTAWLHHEQESLPLNFMRPYIPAPPDSVSLTASILMLERLASMCLTLFILLSHFSFMFGISFSSILRSLNLTSPPSIKKSTLFTLLFLIIDFGAMIALQYWLDVDWFNIENWSRHALDKSPTPALPSPSAFSTLLSFCGTLDTVIVAPFQEEFVLRGLLFHFVAFRLRNSAPPPAPGAPPRTPEFWTALIITNTIFSIVHFINLAAPQYEFSYVVMQVAFAFIIGAYYAIHMTRTRSLWDPIVLHMTNNALGMFLPITTSFDDPSGSILLSIAAVQTLIVYSLLAFWAAKDLSSPPLPILHPPPPKSPWQKDETDEADKPTHAYKPLPNQNTPDPLDDDHPSHDNASSSSKKDK